MLRFLQRFGVLPLVLATGILSAETPEVRKPTTFGERVQVGLISTDPVQWDAETRKEFFGNMPPEYHQQYLDAYAKLREANGEYWRTRAELFGVLHPLFKEETKDIEKDIPDATPETIEKEREKALAKNDPFALAEFEYGLKQYQGLKALAKGDYSVSAEHRRDVYDAIYLYTNWYEFHQYPEWHDPEKQTEYWKALGEDNFFLYPIVIESFRQKTEKHKKQTEEFRQRIDAMTVEDLPEGELWGINGFQFCLFTDTVPLNDEQKLRVINDESLFTCTAMNWPFTSSFAPTFAANEFLEEARNAEREAWKIDATPELSKLAIDQAEVARWDGSLSLHPFIRSIAERCEGINIESLQTTIDHGSMVAVRASITLSNTHPAILALLRGEKDVVFSARRLSRMEQDSAKIMDVELVTIPFAKDAFVFLQNRHNPVRDLTLKQYQGVFSGKYRHWKDVGGFGGDIKPFIRNENSGSEELMQSLVMWNTPVHEDFKPKKLSGMSLVFEELENAPGGIAYSIYHYDRYMVFNAHTRVMAVDGVFPNAETIASGKYPLVYECVLLHRKNPGEKVERFVEWLLSEEGQRLVRSIGYVPIKPGI